MDPERSAPADRRPIPWVQRKGFFPNLMFHAIPREIIFRHRMFTWPPRPCLLPLTRSHVLLWFRPFKFQSDLVCLPLWLNHYLICLRSLLNSFFGPGNRPKAISKEQPSLRYVLALGLECIQLHARLEIDCHLPTASHTQPDVSRRRNRSMD